jgi:hypothetical protein
VNLDLLYVELAEIAFRKAGSAAKALVGKEAGTSRQAAGPVMLVV